MKILVTGAAGFIGHHLACRLLALGHTVVGIDNLNDYYAVSLKQARLARLKNFARAVGAEQRLHFVRIALEERERLHRLFADERFDVAVNLAGQAGVRYSIENPYAYISSNVMGFVNLLECVKDFPVGHFIYASSSSVYGGNTKVPFSESDPVENPVSLYAATKRSDELMAHVYGKLYGIPTTGLRFFTVYGPWGRPDMAPMLFAEAIVKEQPIKVFNYGHMMRDFTYVDDIVEGIVRLLNHVPQTEIPADIYNIGCGRPVALTDFIRLLGERLDRPVCMQKLPMQKGDVERTYADTSKLEAAVGYRATTTLEEGIGHFVQWYTEWRKGTD